FSIFTSTMNDDDMQKVEAEMSPKLAAFNDKIVQNQKLFGRLDTVYQQREKLKLTPEQQRVLWLDWAGFVRQGAKLGDASKKELAVVFTKFTQNLLAEEGTQMVLLTSEKDLEGLSPALKEQAADAAASRGKQGQWAVLNTRSSVEPFLTFSTRRDLREKVWKM